MANHKAAGAAQSKSTFIAGYQKGLSLSTLCPKGYSQGPKGCKQGKETLNQQHDKLVYSAKQRENDQDPSKSTHDGDDIIDGENQKKGPISGIEEEKVKDGNAQKPSGANKKEALVQPHHRIDTDAIRKNEEELMQNESKNLGKKEKTAKDEEEKLTGEMKEQPGEEQQKEHEQELMMKEKEKMKELLEELKKEQEEKMKIELEEQLTKLKENFDKQNGKSKINYSLLATILGVRNI